MYDIYSSATEKIDAYLEIGPGNGDRFIEGDNLADLMDVKDGVYFDRAGVFVVITDNVVRLVHYNKRERTADYLDLLCYDYKGDKLELEVGF